MNRPSQRTAVLLLPTSGGFRTTEESPKHRVAFAMQRAGTPTSEDTPSTFFMTSQGDSCVLCENSSWSYDKR